VDNFEFDIWEFIENLPRKFELHWNLTRITTTIQEDQYTSLIVSRWVILRMRNISDKTAEKIETHISYSINFFFFFRKSCRLCDNLEKYCRDGQATDDNITHAHRICIIRAANTHRICNIYCYFHCNNCYTNSPPSILRYKYMTCLVLTIICSRRCYCMWRTGKCTGKFTHLLIHSLFCVSSFRTGS